MTSLLIFVGIALAGCAFLLYFLYALWREAHRSRPSPGRNSERLATLKLANFPMVRLRQIASITAESTEASLIRTSQPLSTDSHQGSQSASGRSGCVLDPHNAVHIEQHDQHTACNDEGKTEAHPPVNGVRGMHGLFRRNVR